MVCRLSCKSLTNAPHVLLREIRMKLKKSSLAVLLATIAALMSVTFGQSVVTGGISGVITDPSGAVIPDVTLTLRNSSTGEVHVATSNVSGTYAFALLKPGEYTVSLKKEGFQTSMRNVIVTLGTTMGVNTMLQVGSSSTTVEVVDAPGAQLQT